MDLSEGEKEYDRLTAVGTLKAILILGYSRSPSLLRHTQASLTQ